MEQRLRTHSAHFLAMVSLIPAHYYTAREDEDEADDKLSSGRSKKETRFWRNKKAGHQLKHSRKSLHTVPRDQQEEEDIELRENGRTNATIAGMRKQFGIEGVKSTSLSELQQRLHRKIEEVSMKRSLGDTCTQTQRRKRRRRKEAEGGPTKKQQRLEEKQKQREKVKNEQEARQKREVIKRGGASDLAKTGVDNIHFSFNQLEFTQSPNKRSRRKNYQTLIAKAEAKQNQLEELTRQDQEMGDVAQEKEKWSKAVRMARGEKLKDDPSLLRKTVKRLEKKKQTHKKKWGERMKAESSRKDAQQKKRQQNIRERTEKIKAKKARKRAKKKGLV